MRSRYSTQEKCIFRLLKQADNKVENRHIFKGVSPQFCQKCENFLSFYSGKTGQNNTSHDILKGINVYLDHKNKKLKKSKNQNFSKGDSPWVLSKNLKFFHLFICGKIRPENASYDILQLKGAFLDYKNKNLIKSKNTHFFKGVSPWFW